MKFRLELFSIKRFDANHTEPDLMGWVRVWKIVNITKSETVRHL